MTLDFEDAANEAAFRVQARNWLEEHAQLRSDGAQVSALFEHTTAEEEQGWVEACREWQRIKHEAGYAAIAWPKHWGGRDGTLMEEMIFGQEESRFDVATGAFAITLGMIAPTIRTHGTDEQRLHLHRMLSGEEVWCQMFSEPEAGSDLAGLRTTAVRDADEWVISGQKVWTSGAHYADWGYLLARTEPEAPKHLGLTAFIVPMDSQGITIRPLRQMTGTAHFNEVFLDQVRVPDAGRLDAPGSGWRVAITTLMNERVSAARVSSGQRSFRALVALAQESGAAADPHIRQRLAKLQTCLEIDRFMSYRFLTAISKGQVPGPEGSLGKLALVRTLQVMADVITEVAGPKAALDNELSQFLLGVPGARIGGGTDEVMRNIIGERILGLPGEPRVDKDVAFARLSASGAVGS